MGSFFFLEGAFLLVVVETARKGADEFVNVLVQLRTFTAPARYDERCTRLVYENGVDLVDDAVIEFALDHCGYGGFEVVAKVVEAELVIGRVYNVAGIGFFLFVIVHAGYYNADFKTHKFMDLTHPLRVALREVIVDGDYVHALARQSVEVCGERGYERLSFARPAFRRH